MQIQDLWYLSDFTAWNETIAEALANKTNLALKAEHFKVIAILRDFYQQYNLVPSYANLIKILQQQNIDANSIYLLQLFPLGITQICLISGLPKPKDCL